MHFPGNKLLQLRIHIQRSHLDRRGVLFVRTEIEFHRHAFSEADYMHPRFTGGRRHQWRQYEQNKQSQTGFLKEHDNCSLMPLRFFRNSLSSFWQPNLAIQCSYIKMADRSITIPNTPKLSHSRSQHILVVDDHLDNTLLMRELLSRRGYEVLIAANAADAEEIMRQTPPDLVLLDVIMPGKSGYELCREWKDSPETRLIPDRHDHRAKRSRG